MTTALIYASRAGCGGLGMQAATAAAGLAHGGPVVGLGPGRSAVWPLELCPPTLRWEDAPPFQPSWFCRRVLGRIRPGRLVLDQDRRLGRWAADQLDRLRPDHVYAFAQVALESLEWAKARGTPTVLDNPNGHIENFARVYREEMVKWAGGRYHGHPTAAMIDRVKREYELADRIRVSSVWAMESMTRCGVPQDKIAVVPQPVDLRRFRPPPDRPPAEGPLRVVFVGSLDLRKGFVYLLRAVRAVGAERVKMVFVGGTGDRACKCLLARERAGLDVEVRPGDPIPAFQRAELFVLPSLEDGFGFAAAEALACGVAVAVSDQCGAAEWVRPEETGWVIPAGDAAALENVLEQGLADRTRLAEMGRAARASVEVRTPENALRQLADWFYPSITSAPSWPRRPAPCAF